MSAPRLLYLATNVFAKGGIARYSRTQIDTLREILGEERVTALSVHPPRDDKFEEPFVIDYTGQGLSLASRLRYIIRAGQYGLRQKPDLIWTNHIALLPVATTLGRLGRKVNTVLNVYGLEVWSGLSRYELRALKAVTHVVSDCHSTATYMREELKVPANRLSVIWDPVDTDKFKPHDTAANILPRYGVPYSPDTCYILTLGRISKEARYKGYDRVIDAIKSLPDRDIIYLLAGDGNDRTRLEQRVTSEGLHGRVFFLGSIPENDLANVYNACDIFALISDRGPGRGEGVPLTPLEAAACAKPIIVGDEDGSPEAVEPGVNGLIVSPRDPDAIRRAILCLAEDPNRRQQMGQAARQRVIKDFSKQVFKSRTLQVVEKLFEQNNYS